MVMNQLFLGTNCALKPEAIAALSLYLWFSSALRRLTTEPALWICHDTSTSTVSEAATDKEWWNAATRRTSRWQESNHKVIHQSTRYKASK
jgi:hypothetical protein